MSEKKIDKVCIDCIDANEQLKISSDFKVSVEYGTCDCCGKRYIVVPFRRFFSENVKITPCKREVSKNGSIVKEVVKEDPRVEKLETIVEMLKELFDKHNAETSKTISELLESNIQYERRLIELEPKPQDLGTEPEPEKQQKPSKQKDINKAYE